MAEEQQAPKATEPTKKRKKAPIVIGVIVAVIVVAGIGFWHWHEQPSFCGTVCHTMSDHVTNYEEGPGVAHLHQAANVSCLDCHQATLDVQLAEVRSQLAGDTDNLGLADRYYVDNSVCLDCHGGSYEELAKSTEDLGAYNPHANPHGEMNCNECHKGHAEQQDTCSQCHENGGQRMLA